MRRWIWLAGLAMLASPAYASDDANTCSGVAGDVAIAARTPQVDLYDGPTGKRVQTMDGDKFPGCTPIVGRAPNMMLQVNLSGTKYWVPPHMVKYQFSGKLPVVCRNLAMGTNQQKVGATRGLGEGCPQTGGHK
jgi:hypothetical protein